MHPLNLLAYFTTYTVLLSALSVVVRFPPAAMDALRSAVVLVALSVLYVYVRFGTKVILDFYARFGLHGRAVLLYDFLIHFAPLFLVGGFPHTLVGALTGYIVFLAWFLTVRQTVGLESLYTPAISKQDYDAWVFGLLPATLLAAFVATKKMTAK